MNMLTEHDPINAEDVSKISKAEAAASGTGQTQRGGPAAKAQVRTGCRKQSTLTYFSGLHTISTADLCTSGRLLGKPLQQKWSATQHA